MKELRSLFEKAGCRSVATYIQSGNVVFRHAESSNAKLADRFREIVDASFGFSPGVLVLDASDIESAVAGNPFVAAAADPTSLHLWFLSELPKDPDLVAMHALTSDGEEFALQDLVCYLHAPEGIGRSRLAARVEKLLGVSATARNWRTVGKLLDMTAEAP
jgi:uncharacterized protein (DUF1697 family)